MGKPKFSRKKYDTPSHPWQEDRIKAENELVKKYGLKNKREIWKAQTKLKKYRGQARELLAKIDTGDAQSKKESSQLLMHLNRMSILPPNSNLDDVLALETESILSRRLQTLTYLKGLSSTPNQARQLIAHGHIAVDGKKVTVPSYMITKGEESKIGYTTESTLNDLMHPARPRSDYKSPVPIKKDKQADKKGETPKEETPAGKPVEDKKPEEPKSENKEAKPAAEEKPAEDKPTEENKADEPEKPDEEPPKEESTEPKDKKSEKPEETKENDKKEGGD